MKVMVIVKATAASEAGEMPSEQLLTDMGKYNEELASAGIMLAGEGLHASSKGVRVAFAGKDRTVIDGPFPETKELIAGFWMWKVKSMDEAIAWVKRCPNPHDEPCEIEIRQVFSADDFGCEFTPALREQEAAIRAKTMGLGEIRFENTPAISVAGIIAHFTLETRAQIPELWQRFGPQIGNLAGQVGKTSYGVCYNADDDCEFDYLAGVEATADATLPPGYSRVAIPAGRYVVFTHTGHVSTLPAAIDKIWSAWVPESGLKIVHAPCFERYTENFNHETGGAELWIPLAS